MAVRNVNQQLRLTGKSRKAEEAVASKNSAWTDKTQRRIEAVKVSKMK